MTPIVFPDVELELTGYLRANLPAYFPGVFVSNVRGSQTLAVWVRRDGGPELDQVREAPRVGVNVYAPTEQQATNLALTVSALLRSCADGDPILRVRQALGPSPIADETGIPRRFMSFEIHVRGVELSPS